MASPKITIEMTVAQHKAVSNILAVIDKFKMLDKSMSAVGSTGTKAGGQMAQGFNGVDTSIKSAVKSFMGLGVGMRAFGLAVSEVRGEIERFQAFKAASATQGVSFERNMATIKGYVDTGMDDVTRDGYSAVDVQEKIEKDRGQLTLDIASSLAQTAISGGVTSKLMDRVDAALMVGNLMRTDAKPEELTHAARSAVMLMESFDISAKAAAGTYLSMASVSNLTDASKISANLVDPMSALMDLGIGIKDSGVLAVTMNALTRDVKGSSGRNSLINNMITGIRAVQKKTGKEGMDAFNFLTGVGDYGSDPKALEYSKKFLGGYYTGAREDEAASRAAKFGTEEKTMLKMRAKTKIGTAALFQWQGVGRDESAVGVLNRARIKAVRDQLKIGEEAVSVYNRVLAERKTQMVVEHHDTTLKTLQQNQKQIKGLQVAGSRQEYVKEGLGAQVGRPNFFGDITSNLSEYLPVGSAEEEYSRSIDLLKRQQDSLRMAPGMGLDFLPLPFIYDRIRQALPYEPTDIDNERIQQLQESIDELKITRDELRRNNWEVRDVRVVEDESRSGPAVHPEETPALGGVGPGFGAGGQ